MSSCHTGGVPLNRQPQAIPCRVSAGGLLSEGKYGYLLHWWVPLSRQPQAIPCGVSAGGLPLQMTFGLLLMCPVCLFAG